MFEKRDFLKSVFVSLGYAQMLLVQVSCELYEYIFQKRRKQAKERDDDSNS